MDVSTWPLVPALPAKFRWPEAISKAAVEAFTAFTVSPVPEVGAAIVALPELSIVNRFKLFVMRLSPFVELDPNRGLWLPA